MRTPTNSKTNPQQQPNNAQATQAPATEGYYDFTAAGIGKMHFIPAENGRPVRLAVREIKPANGSPYYGVKISAVRGKKGAPDKLKYSACDFTVNKNSKVYPVLEKINDRAVELLEKTGNRQTVNIRFVAGDIEAKKPFKMNVGGKEEYSSAIGGRLLNITHAYIGDECIVKPEENTEATATANSEGEGEGTSQPAAA